MEQRVIAQLDSLLERRAQEAEEARTIHAAWRESERRYSLRQTEERRQAWIGFHRRQAALFDGLAAEHREELGRLIDLGVDLGVGDQDEKGRGVES